VKTMRFLCLFKTTKTTPIIVLINSRLKDGSPTDATLLSKTLLSFFLFLIITEKYSMFDLYKFLLQWSFDDNDLVLSTYKAILKVSNLPDDQ
jgi:hypothetical protein